MESHTLDARRGRRIPLSLVTTMRRPEQQANKVKPENILLGATWPLSMVALSKAQSSYNMNFIKHAQDVDKTMKTPSTTFGLAPATMTSILKLFRKHRNTQKKQD